MPDPYNPWATPIFPGASAFGVGSPAEDAQRQPTIVDNLLSHIAGALGRGFMAPGQALQSTTPITSEQMIAPAQDMSTAMSTGAGAMPASANELRMGIKAYHGSPHDFERFDLSKIGTGEGAQAYGHGLYFAENEAVAKGYRDALAGKSIQTAEGKSLDPQTAVGAMNQRIAEAHPDFGTPTQASQWVFNRIHSGKSTADIERDIRGMGWDESQKSAARTALSTADAQGWKTNPKMYEVNINADPAHFLDWDKPLSQQHPKIKQQLADVYPDLQGDSVQRAFPYGIRPQISETLEKSGIPGIKYLDQGSRGAGQGSSNYVVFNDKLIDILRKYAVPGMMGAPIFANSIGEQKS